MKTFDVFVLVLVLCPISFAVGMAFPRFHDCHEQLADGRKLLSITSDGTTARCKYSTPPGRYEVSAEELRRMARAKERMDKIGHTDPQRANYRRTRAQGN